MNEDAASALLARWRQGDQQAARALFERYANRLTALARSRLSPKVARRLDPEDVVQSAYRSFFAGAQSGRFDLERGGDLWRLLVAITLHKLQDQIARHTAEKRNVGQEKNFGSEDSLLGIQADLLAHTPSPLEAVTLVDELELILRDLAPGSRKILELRLQGCNLDEVALKAERSVSTVRRVLEQVKEQLRQRFCHP